MHFSGTNMLLFKSKQNWSAKEEIKGSRPGDKRPNEGKSKEKDMNYLFLHEFESLV